MTTRPAWLHREIPDASWERIYHKHIGSYPTNLIDDLIEHGWLIPKSKHDEQVSDAIRCASVMSNGRAENAEQQMRELREAIPEATRRVARQIEAVQALLRRDRKTVSMADLRAALGEDSEA